MLNRLTVNNLIISVIALFLLNACVTIYNPATQRKETILIDTETEVALGRDLDCQIRKKLKVLHDPQRQDRLDYIGRKVADSSDRQDLAYHFRIISDKELNAFAIPGGFIYVNSGLMDISTEDELACVLGHEIGHIAARHSVKKLQATLGYQIIMDIVLGLSRNKTVVDAMDIVFGIVSLGYSRKDELLADKLAIKYAKGGGFNSYAMISFFEKLKKETEKRGPNFNLVFLSSHPPIEERIKFAKSEIMLQH